MAVLVTKDTEKQHATDRFSRARGREAGGEEAPPAVDEMRVLEPEDDDPDNIIKEDGRRRKISDGDAQPSRDETEDKIDIYDEQKPV